MAFCCYLLKSLLSLMIFVLPIRFKAWNHDDLWVDLLCMLVEIMVSLIWRFKIFFVAGVCVFVWGLGALICQVTVKSWLFSWLPRFILLIRHVLFIYFPFIVFFLLIFIFLVWVKRKERIVLLMSAAIWSIHSHIEKVGFVSAAIWVYQNKYKFASGRVLWSQGVDEWCLKCLGEGN